MSDEKKLLRAIVAKRLSHLTEVTTHLLTETETTEAFCKRKNYIIVAETEDLDVSGGKPIRERPKIGQWLTLDHVDEWDVLVLYNLSRGFRNHLDFVTFYHEFCEVHGKQIVSVSEDIDMSTRMGRFFAGQLVQFAEWELETMRERRAAAADVIRRDARWNGGIYGFGYQPFKVGNYWYLRPHPVYSQEVRKMAREVVSGRSAATVAADLNERGIPTTKDAVVIQSGKKPKGYKWSTAAVIDYLRSDTPRGYVLHYAHRTDTSPVRVVGPDGEYVRREPLIDDELWYKVQAALDVASRPNTGIRYGGSSLLRIAFCGYCGAVLHKFTAGGRNGKRYHYYTCPKFRNTAQAPATCSALSTVPKDLLEEAVFSGLLDVVGSYEVTEKQVIMGDDHSQTLNKIGMQIADLTTQHYTRGGVPDYHAKMAALEEEHKRISVLPVEKPKIRKVSTGKTFRRRWEEMDDEQRHSYLKSAEVTALVVRRADLTQAMVFDRTTDVSENPVLDIPMNFIRECGDFVVNISLGTLADQLQLASSATFSA